MNGGTCDRYREAVPFNACCSPAGAAPVRCNSTFYSGHIGRPDAPRWPKGNSCYGDGLGRQELLAIGVGLSVWSKLAPNRRAQ
jgi:hypothetical protein